MNMMELHEKIDADIAEYGRSIMGVFPSDDSDDPTNEAFAYTIGNYDKGFPELLVIGMFSDTYTLNELSSQMIKRGRPFDDEEIVSLGGAFPTCVVRAAEEVKENFTVQATAHFGHSGYDVMQVVVPDTKGLFP